MNKKLKFVLISLVSLIIVLTITFICKNNDAKKFKEEYNKVSIKNKFVYKNENEIINTLKNGTGIIFFGFPECPWCQEYVKYLDEVANESSIKEVLYLNILKIRKDNTKEYQKIVETLNDYLDKDEFNNPKIFVPHIVAVKNGKIIGNNNETSIISEPISTTDYWTEEKVNNLKDVLKNMLDNVTAKICTDSCK